MKRIALFLSMATIIFCFASLGAENDGVASVSINDAESSLSEAAKIFAKAEAEKKFVFLIAKKEESEDFNKVKSTVTEFVLKNADKSTLLELDINTEGEKKIVSEFFLDRAPLPIVLVVAPNRAVTAGVPAA